MHYSTHNQVDQHRQLNITINNCHVTMNIIYIYQSILQQHETSQSVINNQYKNKKQQSTNNKININKLASK